MGGGVFGAASRRAAVGELVEPRKDSRVFFCVWGGLELTRASLASSQVCASPSSQQRRFNPTLAPLSTVDSNPEK